MKAVCWYGSEDVRVENVPEPGILNPRDAVVKVTLSAICGSDLHLYRGYVPTMEKGDILGHEFMGEVVEVGREVKNLKAGDRVVVPFTICCGRCFFCQHELWAQCENSNPNAVGAEKMYGYSGAGLFGYSHLFGGYAGGQAQYARVPYADVGPLKVDGGLRDEQVLFLSDILPTAYMAAENCNIKPGDTVAVWGCGPVGQLAVRCAYLLGGERVIALDRVPARLRMAERGNAETMDVAAADAVEQLKLMTGGMGPDACIDAVGMEAHGTGVHVLRECIQACRKGGTVSISGVYGGHIDNFPMGGAFAKGLTLRMGRTHVPKYMKPLLERIQRGEIDPGFLVTHRVDIDDAPRMYRTLREQQDECVKVVMRPN